MSGSATDPGRILILGAGPTGLGAAWRLQSSTYSDFFLLEAERVPGGLAGSAIDEHGFVWDFGGHVHFSHYELYDQVLDQAIGSDWHWREREAWIWLKGRFIPYPIQHHVHHLEAADQSWVLRDGGCLPCRDLASARTFADWIPRTFGEGLAFLFMRPYNEKVWRYPLECMSVSWIGERVAVPDPHELQEAVRRGRDTRAWGPNHRFRYPMHGGTGALWANVARLVDATRLRFNAPVVEVDVEARTVTTASGERLHWDTLISTLPLDILVRCCVSLPTSVRQASRRLVANTVTLVGFGLAGEVPESLARKTWIYYPGPSSPYHRVNVLSNYSPFNVPEGGPFWSLLTEMSRPHGVESDSESVVAQTRRALVDDGLIGPATTVVSTWYRHLSYGYPVPSLDRDDALAHLQLELESRRIFSRGRFGAWKYEVSNQDHSFMQGVEVVDRLLHGAAEVTVTSPETVNSGTYQISARR